MLLVVDTGNMSIGDWWLIMPGIGDSKRCANETI